MKQLYTIHTDLKKSIFSLGVIACAAVTAILCLTANGYHDRSANINYSVFEAILYIDWQTLAENGVTGINIIKFGLSGYCTMFMPIIAALPFVTNWQPSIASYASSTRQTKGCRLPGIRVSHFPRAATSPSWILTTR